MGTYGYVHGHIRVSGRTNASAASVRKPAQSTLPITLMPSPIDREELNRPGISHVLHYWCLYYQPCDGSLQERTCIYSVYITGVCI